jgi:IS1 family transposase
VFAVAFRGFQLGAKPLEWLGLTLDPSVILHKSRLAILPKRLVANTSVHQQEQGVGGRRIQPNVHVVKRVRSVFPVFKVPMKLVGFTGGKDSSLQANLGIPELRVVGKRVVPVPDQKTGIRGNQFSYAFSRIYGTPIEPGRSGSGVEVFHCAFNGYPRPLTGNHGITLSLNRSHGSTGVNHTPEADCYQRPIGPFNGCVLWWCFILAVTCFVAVCLIAYHCDGRFSTVVAFAVGFLGIGLWFYGRVNCETEKCNQDGSLHGGKIVTQKLLTSIYYRNTVIDMANVLSTDKQIAAISALAEGSSIRSIERMTGVHRDTVMRLGVRVGEGCARLLDAKMRDLPCTRLELDEIWGFVGKKDKSVRLNEPRPVGNVWTFCAIDADSKLVPAFRVGDRSVATAKAFVNDVAGRMRNRVQISTDGLRAYVEAIEGAFGSEVDFAQIVKTYGHEEVSDNRRYSAPEFVSCEKKVVTGNPNPRLISTSYVERLNATTRLHMRRLTRLTLAFSKKRENFEAAVALHFAYYNFVKRHNTLRCTPAMAAGIERDFWSVGDHLEAV